MASSRDEGLARASLANACPVSPLVPNIQRIPHAAPCWPSARDSFPSTIETIAAIPPPSPPLVPLPRSAGSTSCSAQMAVPATLPPAHSPHPHGHEQFPARPLAPAAPALTAAHQAAPRSSLALPHPAACAARSASGRTPRGSRALCLRRPPHRPRSRTPAAQESLLPFVPTNPAARAQTVFRRQAPLHKSAALFPDQSA